MCLSFAKLGSHVTDGDRVVRVAAAVVEPFIEFLKSIESGAFVLIASFDEPGTK